MSKFFVSVLVLAVAAATPLSLSAQAAAPAPPARFLASNFKDWHPAGDGVMRMNLVGDSMQITGYSAHRLRYPNGSDSTKAEVHFHMGTKHITVLKGTLLIGFGEEVDFSKVKEYTAEGFVVVPSGRPHYHWTRGDTEIQVEAIGQTGTHRWPRIQRPIGANPPPPPPVDSTHVWKNGLPEWSLGGGGGSRMNLVGHRPPSTTELIAYRSFRPARANADTTRVIYHYHFGSEYITVFRGSFYFGIGEKVDRDKAIAYGPGSFIENPSGAKHFEWFTGEAYYQVHGLGSLGAIPLDPNTGQPPVAVP